jgi:hypothetical protein
MVPQLATAQGGCLSMGTEKIRPIAGNDRPLLISPPGILVEALGVCGKGLQRTAWEPLADVGCAVHSMRDVVGKVQSRISTLTVFANFLVLIFRNEYLENVDQAHGFGDGAPQVAPFKRHSGPVARQHMLRKAPHFS